MKLESHSEMHNFVILNSVIFENIQEDINLKK